MSVGGPGVGSRGFARVDFHGKSSELGEIKNYYQYLVSKLNDSFHRFGYSTIHRFVSTDNSGGAGCVLAVVFLSMRTVLVHRVACILVSILGYSVGKYLARGRGLRW